MSSHAYQQILHQGKPSWNVKLIIYPQLRFRLKMHATLPLLPHTVYLLCMVFKHRDNLTVTL
jgi:hypothetical protein